MMFGGTLPSERVVLSMKYMGITGVQLQAIGLMFVVTRYARFLHRKSIHSCLLRACHTSLRTFDHRARHHRARNKRSHLVHARLPSVTSSSKLADRIPRCEDLRVFELPGCTRKSLNGGLP